MKSGLYITEIVKRLYRSEKMRQAFPDDNARLKHIFAQQVYGLAPTEIIYRIAISYILGFAKDHGITAHHIRQADTLEFAKLAPWKGNWIRFSEIEKIEYSINQGWLSAWVQMAAFLCYACYKNESCWIHHIEQDERSHSLFLPKFPLYFLAHCRKWRALETFC